MTAHDAAPPRNAVGLAIIVAASVAVAAWLFAERPESPERDAERESRSVDELALPDGELLGFVEIPEGPFTMGSDAAVDPRAFDNEYPQTTVELPTFFIGRYEVTVAQYRAFVEATHHTAEPEALAASPDHPVSFVSWPDALAYCRWLETTLRESPRTPQRLRDRLDDGWTITLPDEAQWEKAARGSDGRIFPWGNEPLDDRANYENRRSSATAVGSFACPECAYGLLDMSGNVWELTRSPYRPYPFDPDFETIDLEAGALFVMRGGSYADPAQNIRTTIRGGVDPGARRPFIGFRLVLEPSR